MVLKNVIFGLIGGLGLFIFGMKFLSDGLQKVAGTKLRRILRSLTKNKFRGIALGAIVTSIVQSSSVTTVMLIGLINAGIINLIQSAGVVIGANIGTTITAQIIAFKVAQYALPAIGIGVVMMLIPRKRKFQFWGQIIFAFGLIFLGLSTMSGVMEPLKDIPAVTHFFVQLSSNPILGILLGAIFTMMIQSSSASIGMVMALATVGLIDFRAALFLILGGNVGTTVTAWLASIGGSLSAKRMACFHTLFNVIGVCYFSVLVYSGVCTAFLDFITPGPLNTDTIARHIANAHTFFKVVNAGIFVLIIGPVVSFIKIIMPGKDMYVSTDFKYLQDKLLNTPDIAVVSVRKELAAMAKLVKNTIVTAVEGFFSKDNKSIAHVSTQESAIDHLQNDITFYLAKLSSKSLSPELASQLPPLLHSINDLERVSDHAVNIAELTEKIYADNIPFTNNALAEMRTIYAKVEDMIDETVRCIEDNDEASSKKVINSEEEVNKLQKSYLAHHSKRLCDRKCSPASALIFVDFINNIEKIGDHLTNIAEAAAAEFTFREELRKG